MRSVPSSPLFPRLTVSLALIAAATAPAWAQLPSPPPDFHATARLAGFDQDVEIRVSGLRRRVDLATDAVVETYIADRARGVLIVMTAAGRRRLALAFPAPRDGGELPVPLDLAELKDSQGLSRIGAAMVAGRPCALWRYVGHLGRNGMVCATAEGVLRLTPDGRPTPIFEVLALDKAPQDPRWFQPPPDYQVAVLPGLGGAAAPSSRP